MEINMRCMIKRQFTVAIVCLWGLLCAPEMNAMRIGAELYGERNPVATQKNEHLKNPFSGLSTDQVSQLIIKRNETAKEFINTPKVSLLTSTECLICQEGTSECIQVKKNIFPYTEMMSRHKDTSKEPLFLDFPIEDIRNAVNIAKTYYDAKHHFAIFDVKNLIQKYSLPELVNAVKFLNYVDCPNYITDICSREIEMRIENGKITIQEMRQLEEEEAKELLMSPITKYLKRTIITKNKSTIANLKGKEGNADLPHSTVWSIDGNKIGIADDKGMSLWNVTNPANILYTPVSSNETDSIAFSPDSTLLTFSQKGTIVIWNIKLNRLITTIDTECDKIPSLAFIAEEETASHIAYVASSHSGSTSLQLLNLSTQTSQTIGDNLGKISAVAINPENSDRKMLAAHCRRNFKDYIELFNIRQLNNIKLLKSILLPSYYKRYNSHSESIIFSPDSSMILSTNKEAANTVYVVNISNLGKIIPKELHIPTTMLKQVTKGDSIIDTAVFTPDGKNIISAGDYNTQTLFLWDISNLDDTSCQFIGYGYAVSVAPTFAQGCKIVYQDRLLPQLQTLWTAHEQKAFESLQECDTEQLIFIGDLCLKLKKGLPISIKQGTDDWNMFESLPIELQNLLESLLKSRPRKKTPGWFSGWW